MDEYSAALLEAMGAAIPRWVERSVIGVCRNQSIQLDDEAAGQIEAAGIAARDEVTSQLDVLLGQDVDEQRSNPLDIVRRVVHHPTAVLARLGARPVRRDEFAQRVFPEDVYGLSPATFADVDESLQEAGIIWGAWKAKTVLDRRRDEGRR